MSKSGVLVSESDELNFFTLRCTVYESPGNGVKPTILLRVILNIFPILY